MPCNLPTLQGRTTAVPAERLPRPAEPTIEQVFRAFLDEQRARLKPATLAKYETVLSLLESHLDNYAYEGLSKAERSLFERHFNAEGEQHRGFCQLFGPDKLPDNLGSFFGYSLPSKVLGGPNLRREAATVTKKLLAWLVAQGYVSAETARERMEEAAARGRVFPRAEKSGHGAVWFHPPPARAPGPDSSRRLDRIRPPFHWQNRAWQTLASRVRRWRGAGGHRAHRRAS